MSEIVGGHLERLGHPLPSTANPADSTMLELVRDLGRVRVLNERRALYRCEEPEV